MRKILIACILVFNALVAQPQIISRAKGDDKIAFLRKNGPPGLAFSENLVPQTIETKEWSLRNAIIGFYERSYKLQGDNYEYVDVLGYLFFPIDSNSYQRVFIDTFENEGGTAEIASIFFANADTDPAREMVILIKWPCVHYQIDGNLYETRIFNNVPASSIPRKMVYLKQASKKVSGGFDGYREGENVISKYKTSQEIRARLKSLGY